MIQLPLGVNQSCCGNIELVKVRAAMDSKELMENNLKDAKIPADGLELSDADIEKAVGGGGSATENLGLPSWMEPIVNILTKK